MNVMEIAKNFPNVKFEISGADLIEFGMELVEMSKAKENERTQEQGTMSQREAAKYLGKSVTTICRWQKEGYIKPCAYVGASPMYYITDLKRMKEGSEYNNNVR